MGANREEGRTACSLGSRRPVAALRIVQVEWKVLALASLELRAGVGMGTKSNDLNN